MKEIYKFNRLKKRDFFTKAPLETVGSFFFLILLLNVPLRLFEVFKALNP